MYSPDKLEQWLEAMEMKGFNLYKVGKSQITFFFVKASPRKVKYCVDYQNRVNEDYFNINKDAGWKLNFGGSGISQKWNIWSKEYSDLEKVPEMYTNYSEKVEHAKKVARMYSYIYIPIIIMYILVVSVNIWVAIDGNRWPKTMVFMLIAILICIINFSIFTINGIRYYFRIKNSA